MKEYRLVKGDKITIYDDSNGALLFYVRMKRGFINKYIFTTENAEFRVTSSIFRRRWTHENGSYHRPYLRTQSIMVAGKEYLLDDRNNKYQFKDKLRAISMSVNPRLKNKDSLILEVMNDDINASIFLLVVFALQNKLV